MKRRIAVFGLVWAFTLNAFWVPGGLDSGYFLSVFFPALYFFLLGLIVGAGHEALATRWPRLWLFPVAAATLTYICVAMFGGNIAGLHLALPMALATGLASLAAATSCLTQHPSVPNLGRFLAMASVICVLHTSACVPYWRDAREMPSPNNAYLARIEAGIFDGLNSGEQPVHVGPRYAPPTWFSSKVAMSYTMHWKGNQMLYTNTSVPEDIYGNYLDIQVKTTFRQ